MDLIYTVLDRLGTSKRQVYINGLKSIPIYKELLEHCNSNVELIKLDPSFDLEDHTLFISPKCINGYFFFASDFEISSIECPTFSIWTFDFVT